jgi:peptidase M1-like protein
MISATSTAWGQAQTPMPSTAQITSDKAQTSRKAEQLYLQLRSADLDPSRVYHIREASLDRDRLHITLEDGTIAFTRDVEGRVTGAFFEGHGEVLLVPTDQAERASMSLFTGAAILEEQFSTAYLRFNDDTFRDLEASLRETEDKDFATRWSSTALNLAEWDALRLFVTFSRYLPVEGAEHAQPPPYTGPPDRFLHARVGGEKLGAFDVYYDSTASEPIVAAQQKTVENVHYYNVWAALAARASGTSPQEPPTSDEIAIPSYRIHAEVTPPTGLHADTRAQMEVVRGGSRALLFELSRYLQVSAVTMGDTPLEFIQNQALEGSQLALRGNDILAVVFPRPLKAGETFQLRFTYGGTVLSEAGGGLLYVGARGTWYPNRGLATADFDLQFHYPAGWTLVATGKSTSPEPPAGTARAPQEQVSRWVTTRPIPLAGFNLGRYQRATAQAGDVTVGTYAAAGVERTFPKSNEVDVVPQTSPPRPRTPPLVVPQPPVSPVRQAQYVADTAARTLDFYAARFGPYPYGTLELTQMPGPLSQGWPGLIFLSSYAFLTPEERARLHLDPVQTILSRQVTAHEIAHQWWGDLVFWKSYRDQWISEALANYSSLMMLESQDPASFHAVLQRYREDLLRKNKNGAVLKDAGPVTLGQRLSSFEFPDGYEAISYGRGTWLFHMLRTMLDDAANSSPNRKKGPTEDPFLQALRRVRERYAGKPITSQQLMDVFAEDLPPSLRYEGRKSLDWFYEGWVDGTSLPKLELQGVKLVPRGQSVLVTGSILQKNAPGRLVTSVPLYALLAGDRRVYVARIFADGSQSSFRLTAPAGTRRILIDPEQTLLTSAH